MCKYARGSGVDPGSLRPAGLMKGIDVNSRSVLGAVVAGAALLAPISATAAIPKPGTIANPYFCGTYTFPATKSYMATQGLLSVGSGRGAAAGWTPKAAGCRRGRKQMKHAYWKNAHMHMPGWKCVTQFGTASCKRAKVEISFTFS